MRHLASIKKITAINPIPGKDRIGLATVDGWTVIVNKADYQEGDLCVYVEIDSVLPEKPEFEFLRSKDFRIKTMKMAGCISQGICFPLDILPPGDYKENDDVTEVIGVTKWERVDATDELQEVKAKKLKYPKWLMRWKWFRNLVYRRGDRREAKGFPSFISKTDETRIQNAPFYLDNPGPWVVTEKIDGQSGTFALVRHKKLFRTEYEYVVCSLIGRCPISTRSRSTCAGILSCIPRLSGSRFRASASPPKCKATSTKCNPPISMCST